MFLSKKIILASLLTLGLVAGSVAVGQVVMQGEFDDGTTIHWVCLGNKKYEMPVQISTADGKVYQAVLSCGEYV